MLIPRKLLWALVSAASAALAGAVTRKAVEGAWRLATGGDSPTEADDDTASLGAALAWAAGVGAAAGVGRVLSRRTAAGAWEKVTGEPPPGEVVAA